MADKTDGFIEDQEPEHPLFTAKELEDIRKQAKQDILSQKKKAAREMLLEEEKARLQREEGFVVGNTHKDEIVTLTIDLAPYADRILVNGASYYHARTYTVPRHVADSLKDTMFRTWQHQKEIKGESLTEFYAQKHVSDLFAVKKGGRVIGRNDL